MNRLCTCSYWAWWEFIRCITGAGTWWTTHQSWWQVTTICLNLIIIYKFQCRKLTFDLIILNNNRHTKKGLLQILHIFQDLYEICFYKWEQGNIAFQTISQQVQLKKYRMLNVCFLFVKKFNIKVHLPQRTCKTTAITSVVFSVYKFTCGLSS